MSTLLGLQPFRAGLCVTVLCISGGMVMATLKSTDFHAVGFAAVLGAGFMAATRWVTTERYFTKNGKQMSSMQLLYMMSPVRWGAVVYYTILAPLSCIAPTLLSRGRRQRRCRRQ